MAYGVIGVGAIAAAIVTGLCEGAATAPDVLLSPRNAAVAAGLAARFPSVRVCADNQAVVDGAATLMLCLRPSDAEGVLAGLAFRADQSIVSAMAGIAIERLAAWVAPATDIARAIPLPAVARRAGLTAVHPATSTALALFEPLGGTVAPPGAAALDALSAATATAAAHFAALGAVARWLAARGLPADEAERYVASVYAGLAEPMRAGQGFEALAMEFTTPGGLNAQFRRHMAEAGQLDAVASGLDALLARLRG